MPDWIGDQMAGAGPNGSMLILAVGLAVQAAERRQRRGAQAEEAAAAGAVAPVVE